MPGLDAYREPAVPSKKNPNNGFGPVKMISTGVTGPVNILECSRLLTSFPSRMSPNVFEINEDDINFNKCQ